MHQNDETTLFIRGGDAVRQLCASCTGAGYERSTEPLERLPVLGGRRACNYEQDTPAAALAWDKLGADYRLLFESSGQYTPGGQHRRRMGSCADDRADAVTQPPTSATGQQWRTCCMCNRPGYYTRNSSRFAAPLDRVEQWKFPGDIHIYNWFRSTYAHREQVHSFLYVAAHRLTPKGVAV